MRLSLTLIPLLAFAACASEDKEPTTSKENASHALTAATQSLSRASKQSNAAFAANVSYTGPCLTRGSICVDGSENGADDGSRFDFDVSAKFNACTLDADSLDGNVHVKVSQNLTGVEADIDGSLDWIGANDAASCAFDLHIKAGSAGISLTGTACGYDVEDLDFDIDDLDLDFGL
jgi:hypothetical protein